MLPQIILFTALSLVTCPLVDGAPDFVNDSPSDDLLKDEIVLMSPRRRQSEAQQNMLHSCPPAYKNRCCPNKYRCCKNYCCDVMNGFYPPVSCKGEWMD
ncbi:unnamed protein product [Nezara viridula]|uniref:Neuropeptide n=1 Tax=Nezara viridula TaxID=85310 RepID=A0A9P0HFH1_NEZVI|nr:unnamed protein product [Nezara viridula]